MRVAAEVNALFHDKSFIERANFLSGVKGGWERWFQLELAFYIAFCFADEYEVTLEDSTVYPGTHMRADLVLRSDRTITVVELKCQTAAEDIDGFLARIEDDIANIPDLAPGNDYQVIALVRGRKEVETLCRKLTAKHRGQVDRFTFPQSLHSPNGFVSFFQGSELR